jgi:hypothetical protein
MAKADYDVSNIVRAMLDRQIPHWAENFAHLREECIRQPIVNRMLAEIGQHAADANISPLELLRLGIIYGMTLGVYLEKDHTARQKRVV